VLCFIGAFFVFGVLISVLIPPFQAPDENVHWLAAYARSNFQDGSLDSKPDCAFAYTLPDVFETGRIAFKAHEKIDGKNYHNVSTMAQSCKRFGLAYGYVGTYPGMLLARLLTTKEDVIPDKTLQVFFLARIFQGAFIVFLLLRLYSVMIASNKPIPGMLFMLAGMISPIFLQQSFAVSADGITFLLTMSLLFFLLFMKQAKWWDWIILFYLSISVAATKPPLLLMVPAFLYTALVISDISKKNILKLLFSRSKTSLLIHLCIVSSLLGAIWVLTKDHAPPAHQILGRDLSIKRQLFFTMDHPWFVLKILIHSVGNFFSVDSILGSLGWLDTPLSEWTKSKMIHLLIFAGIVDGVHFSLIILRQIKQKKEKMYWVKKLASVSMLFLSLYGTALFVALTLYLTWSPVGGSGIDGLQSRYFFPVLLALPMVVGYLGFVPDVENTVEPIHSEIQINNIARLCAYLVSIPLIIQLFCPLCLDLLRRWW
jgi:uncharacterized membrane protein